MALPPRTSDESGLKNNLGRFVDLLTTTVPSPHPAGVPFIVGALGVAGVGHLWPGTLGRVVRSSGLLSAAASAVFFRNPLRVAPDDTAAIVAPADGRVSLVDTACAPRELQEAALSSEYSWNEEPLPRVSVFLSLFDVHVQHSPVQGQVVSSEYRPGTFLSAELPEASERNERHTLVIRESQTGHFIIVSQIAGLLARRIVCKPTVGSEVRRGDVYGLIRFGSRVDVYLPPGARPLVKVGQRAVAGETSLAVLP